MHKRTEVPKPYLTSHVGAFIQTVDFQNSAHLLSNPRGAKICAGNFPGHLSNIKSQLKSTNNYPYLT